MNKQILISAGIVFLSFNVMAENESTLPSCGDNCTYTIENGTLTIMPIDSSKPASTASYLECPTYTTCYSSAPWYGSGVTKVVVGDGITSLGKGAFFLMRSVTSVDLPEGLQTISQASFEWTNITSIDLPSTLTTLGPYAFAYSPLESINGIPAGVTTLDYRTFCNTNLQNLAIPDTVITISSEAFGGGDDYHSQALIQNLYCPETLKSQCQSAIQWQKDNGIDANVIPYQKTPDGQVFYNNKWYATANDITTGNHIKKRIYTVNEADKVTGKVNRVSIKYR